MKFKKAVESTKACKTSNWPVFESVICFYYEGWTCTIEISQGLFP